MQLILFVGSRQRLNLISERDGMALVIGTSSTNENARAILSLEFSKEFLKPALDLSSGLSKDALSSLFQEAHARSNQVFGEFKPEQKLTENDILSRYPSSVMQGDLPDGMDALLGRIALKSTSGTVACVVLIQTSYDSPWKSALCVIGNAEPAYYAVFDPSNGTLNTCKNVDVSIRSLLEKEAGIYYRALFLSASAPAQASVQAEPVAIVEVKVEKKDKKPAVVRKRPAPSTAPTASAQPEEKRAALVPSSPPPPPAASSTTKKDE